MFIRPATMADHTAVLELAKQAGFGMTSLPPDPAVLAAKIEASEASFSGQCKKPGQESFFFVMEDADNDGHIAGTCGIWAHIGLSQPFYSYKITTITQASPQLDVFSKQELLQVTNDLTGSTEVGALFLQPAYRRDRMGKLISLARFMFIAAFPHYFDEQIVAEMRGVHDLDGVSPFYNALPRHFFGVPFTRADYINATQGTQFINDLMPKYPIYISLLPKSARKVIGAVNAASEPAKAMLERQGFKYNGYIDIFDGGPTLLAQRDQLHAVQQSKRAVISGIENLSEDTNKYIVSNDLFREFRCAAGRLQQASDGSVIITERLARRVNVKPGDSIRYYPI